MSFDYSRSLDTATRLIGRYGAPLVIRRNGPSGGPNYAPSRASALFLEVLAVRDTRKIWDREAKVSIESVSFLVQAKTSLTVEKGNKMMFTGAAAFMLNPQEGLFVPEFSVLSISPLSPGGVVLFYQIEVES